MRFLFCRRVMMAVILGFVCPWSALAFTLTPTVVDVIINRDTPVPITTTWQMPPITQAEPTFGKRKVRK